MSQLIPTINNTKTITDLREDALGVLRQLRKSGPTYIFHRSEPRAVMLSIEEYKRIADILEKAEAVTSVLRSRKQAENGKAKRLKSLKDI